MSNSIRVLVTGSAGRIGYSLLPLMGGGLLLGGAQKIDLVLFDIPEKEEVLHGLRMELVDCGFPLLNRIIVCTDPEKAFTDAEVVIFLGAAPRGEGMQRSDLLHKNKAVFEQQGLLLEKFAKKHVKALVVGNPANTNALVLGLSCPSIPKENIVSLMRLDTNRTTAMVCSKLGKELGRVTDVISWGNHSPTLYPSIDFVKVDDQPHPEYVTTMKEWVENEMVPTVRKRGNEVIVKLGSSSALSAAHAICDQMRDWFLGSQNRIVTMGVFSEGAYGVSGVVYGMPVRCTGNFNYQIVDDLPIAAYLREHIDFSFQELLKEKELALSTF